MFVAHRGDLDVAKENTLASFKAAMQSPIQMIELDLRLSSDNVWMVIHDQTLTRTINIHAWVKDYTAQELQQFSIPTLEEVLKLVNGQVSLYLDLKGLLGLQQHHALWDQLTAVCEDQETGWDYSKLYLASFNEEIMYEMMHLKITSGIKFPLGMIYDHYLDVGNPDETLLDQMDFVSVNCDILTEEYIECLKDRELQVFCYTCNDLLMLRKYLNMKVDGILSDFPQLFSLLND